MQSTRKKKKSNKTLIDRVNVNLVREMLLEFIHRYYFVECEIKRENHENRIIYIYSFYTLFRVPENFTRKQKKKITELTFYCSFTLIVHKIQL